MQGPALLSWSQQERKQTPKPRFNKRHRNLSFKQNPKIAGKISPWTPRMYACLPIQAKVSVAKVREDRRHLRHFSAHLPCPTTEDKGRGNAVTVSKLLANAFMGLLLWLHQKYSLLCMEATQVIHTLLLATEMKARHGSDSQPCSDFAIFTTELSEGTMVKHKYIPLSWPFSNFLVCRLFIP